MKNKNIAPSGFVRFLSRLAANREDSCRVHGVRRARDELRRGARLIGLGWRYPARAVHASNRRVVPAEFFCFVFTRDTDEIVEKCVGMFFLPLTRLLPEDKKKQNGKENDVPSFDYLWMQSVALICY